MRDRLIIIVGGFLAVVAVVLFFVGPSCDDPPLEPDAAVPDAFVADAFVRLDAMAPDAFSVDDETVTLEQAKRIGMVDRPARLLEGWFADNPNWTHDPKVPAPTWVNQNGVRLSFKVRGGKVVSAGATFPEDAMSADLTALSEFFVGQHDALPMRFEPVGPDDVVMTSGGFEDRLGRRFYFRGRLNAEPPGGPAEFEIKSTPWPGQSAAVMTFEDLINRDAPLDKPPPPEPPAIQPPATVDAGPAVPVGQP